jgi:hypothetical protein
VVLQKEKRRGWGLNKLVDGLLLHRKFLRGGIFPVAVPAPREGWVGDGCGGGLCVDRR